MDDDSRFWVAQVAGIAIVALVVWGVFFHWGIVEFILTMVMLVAAIWFRFGYVLWSILRWERDRQQRRKPF